ncbi:MAG: DsrE family protein [Propionibacteriaceae bacterium]
MSQADRWPAALSNLRNLCQLGLAENVTVVINGTAIYVIQGQNDWIQAMKEAAECGVRFEICERSLENHGLPIDSLPKWVTPIWAAIPIISEYVGNGYTYVKP